MPKKRRRSGKQQPRRVVGEHPRSADPAEALPPADVLASALEAVGDDELSDDEAWVDSSLRPFYESTMRLAVGFLGDDFDEAVAGLELGERRDMARFAGIGLDPRYVRGGFGPFLRRRLPHLDAQRAVMVSWPAVADIEYDTYGLLESDDLESADAAEVARVVEELHQRHPLPLVTLWMATAGWLDPAVAQAMLPHVANSLEALGAGEHDEASQIDDSGGEEETGAEDEPGLFTPLDLLLIRTMVAVHGESIGAPSRVELRQLVDEVIHLNTERRSSYIHAGFLSALDAEAGAPPETILNDERRRAFRFGRLNGLARRGELQPLADEAVDHRDEVMAVLADPLMAPPLLRLCVKALLPEHPTLASALLNAGPTEVRDAPLLFAEVYERARQLLAEGDGLRAQALFSALIRFQSYGDAVGGEPEVAVDLLRRISACQRAENNFVAALELLEQVPIPSTAASRALLAAERGLVVAEVDHLSHVRFPHSAEEAAATGARLRRAGPFFESALADDPDELRAGYCMGVLAAIDDDHERALPLFDRVLRRLDEETLAALSALGPGVRFHRAVALLQTAELGVDGPAFAAMCGALDAGYVPPPSSLVDALDALATLESRHTSAFLERVLEADADIHRVVDVIQSRAAEGDPVALVATERLNDHRRLTTADRLALLEAALAGSVVIDDIDRADRLVDQIDELLVTACQPGLDREWERFLCESDRVRTLLGPANADMQRIEVLRRIGDNAAALSLAEAIFYRANAGALDHLDAGGVLELMRELGAEPDRLEALEQALPNTEEAPVVVESDDANPVRVLFVGGNEIQQAYHEALEREIDKRFFGSVTVRWFSPGWSSNWNKTADQVESLLPGADALVLMAFVRTNLGRTLRAAAGRAGVPWLACTGHGRQSLAIAIARAVEVARRAEGVAG